MKISLLPLLCLGALPTLAQLPAPNAAGVSAGHDIMVVKDLEAANKFWNALGAEPAQLGTLKMIKFPGVLFLMRQGMNQGGTEGSSVEFIGLEVQNLDGAGMKLDGKGYTKAKNLDLAVCLITDPWGTYIEMSEGLAAVK